MPVQAFSTQAQPVPSARVMHGQLPFGPHAKKSLHGWLGVQFPHSPAEGGLPTCADAAEKLAKAGAAQTSVAPAPTRLIIVLRETSCCSTAVSPRVS